ncbi:MAG TPA: zinc-binding dehydrogenase [Clostridiales bacterium]|jgi:threonine dehydrogenase-like Zn-dependent dehydrogenase|nr:zinc-binding dehydrogenase [Clostridiales bacterium]
METTAVRLYGKRDLRLEKFELPEIKDDEILARVISDSICMSSYKAAEQGADHKRVPDNVAENPVIIGHEFCGELVKVGADWADQYKEGEKFVIQPALNYQGSLNAPGYSYQYIGGAATYIIIPKEVMIMNCLLPYDGDSWFAGSLTEPYSCVVGAFHASYHTVRGKYEHSMGITPGGRMAVLAGAGPMGLAAIDYIINCDRRPSFLAVTDIDGAKLKRAEELLSPAKASENGVELKYVNTRDVEDPKKLLTDLAGGLYDDVFVFAPVASVIELADSMLGEDGCLNFFAGPTDPTFTAKFNFYNVHYASTHLVGTSGGNDDDMRESLEMMKQGKLTPSVLVTHIGGLDSVIDATLNLPGIPGGKKLIYTGISMRLTAIADFEILGETDPLFSKLHELTAKTNGLWNAEAEKYLLENAKAI